MNEFRPLPLLGNPHVQTLLGTYLKGPLFSFPSRVRAIPLPDGDRLVLHDSAPPGWQPGGRVVLLVHGLGGSHRSGYMGRLAGRLLAHGFRAIRVDLRGAGRGFALARRPYHSGCSDDLREVIAAVQRWSPASRVSLIGVSLGGNAVLKLAGEASEQPVPGLACVAALAPPIDLALCVDLLQQPRNRFYETHFVRTLVTLARRRQRLFPELPAVRFPREMSLRQFDELYTAPCWGFAGASDYYRRASSLPYISEIRVPTQIMTARDDPFIAVEPFETLRTPGCVQLRIVPHGGHVGFLGWDGGGGIRWAERRLVEFVLRQGNSS